MPLGLKHPFDLLSPILLEASTFFSQKDRYQQLACGGAKLFSQCLVELINLTRSHEVVREKLSLAFIVFSKGGSKRSPQLGIGSPVISFPFLSTFPLLNAIKFCDTSSCCSLELDFMGGRVLA